MIQNCTTYKILNVFFENPLKKFGLKEISILSKIAHTSVKKELERLIKNNIIKRDIEIKGKRRFPIYYADTNEKFRVLKKIFNEYKIINTGIVEYIKNHLTPNSIILFGSFSKGEDVAESDIDLFIEAEFKNIDLKKFEKKLGKEINLTFKKDINDLNKEFLHNILNGSVLYGEIYIK